jgi:5-methylcytosine-specific restriction endonuclease McrA
MVTEVDPALLAAAGAVVDTGGRHRRDQGYYPHPPVTGYAERLCEVCGVSYRPTYGSQRTCGRQCGKFLKWVNAGKLLSEPRLYGQHTRLIVCQVCGRLAPKVGNRVLCGDCTQHDRNASRWRATVASRPPARCGKCAAAVPRHQGRVLCRACAAADERRRKAATGNHRKRARKAGVHYETVNKQRVFERDGYRCYICGRKTSIRGGPFSPRYPTLDHLVPFACGGPHTYANTACACRECNTRKGAGASPAGDQLRLVG